MTILQRALESGAPHGQLHERQSYDPGTSRCPPGCSRRMSRRGLAMAEITPEGHQRAVAEPERIERILSAMSMWSMAPTPGPGVDRL